MSVPRLQLWERDVVMYSIRICDRVLFFGFGTVLLKYAKENGNTGSLVRFLERLSKLLDLFHFSVSDKAHRKHLGRGGSLKGDWTNPSVRHTQSGPIRFLHWRLIERVGNEGRHSRCVTALWRAAVRCGV